MPASAQPALDEKTLATQYGWAASLLNSNPELKALFHQAVLGTWTEPKFGAELRNTHWFRSQSASTRSMLILSLIHI